MIKNLMQLLTSTEKPAAAKQPETQSKQSAPEPKPKVKEEPMITKNPFFLLYDKLSGVLHEDNAVLTSSNNLIANAINSIVANAADWTYFKMTEAILERGKFYFGSTHSHMMFSEWCKEHTPDEIMFAIERTGLLIEERIETNPIPKNPFERVLAILDDPRSKLGFNIRGEFEVIVPASACADHHLDPAYNGYEKSMTLDTIIEKMCRLNDSFLAMDPRADLMLSVVAHLFPDVKIEKKSYWSVGDTLKLIPFDEETMRNYITECAQLYQENYMSEQLELLEPDPTGELAVIPYRALGENIVC